MTRLKMLLVKVKVSLSSAASVFKKPAYTIIALVTTLIASSTILWALNLGLIQYIIFEAPISTLSKVSFFLDVYKDVFTDFSSVRSTLLIAFSVLFGINASLLVFVLRHRGFRSLTKKSGLGGFTLALLSGGCMACGTSLVAPLLATFGATAIPLFNDLAIIFMFAGTLLICYSIYELGAVGAVVQAKEKNKT